MADIVENLEIDKDTVSVDELEKIFSKKYNLLTETAVTLKKTYINKLSINKSLHVAVSVLDNSIEVYQLTNSSLSKVCRLSGHRDSLTELVFNPKEEHLLYSAGHDGIKLWDTRSNGLCAQEYKDEPDAVPRQYECMDVSCSGRLLAAGSALQEDDAYLVFWDVRNPQPLGGYWNSHTDDITQVKFHKEKSEILSSGSLDGLLNIYNVLEATEDDALTYSLNVDNSIEKISWLSEDVVACCTQSHDAQLWNSCSGDLLQSYDREKIARGIKRLRADDCYLVDMFTSRDKSTVILTGSYSGEGNLLRSATAEDKKLRLSCNFIKNKQVVRCLGYDAERDILITAGESGLVTVWSPDGQGLSQETKQRSRAHNNRHRPY
ncbi:putative WD-repeat protein YNL035C [Danaus plexippus plexippus]|uniref:WD repeat-containing protein 89 n=1 Tax=Danaus plexippus plexippus TaxID=278856 RepID=A0A212EK02_DANPL|nr:putative WD-repeat protein YNL035C [Danaus plexippus plexippus]